MLPKKKHTVRAFLAVITIGILSISCSDRRKARHRAQGEATETESETKPQRLASYTIKGFIFVYYLIPSGLGRDELIATAQALHDREPKAHLILVDDRTQLDEYIHYAKESSLGHMEAPFPKEWADRHVIANAQRYISGKWMLCESYGYNEIAELK
jgi:hypothetical protein